MKFKKKLKVSIVIPCFNEEENIEEISNQIVLRLKKEFDYEIIFVDDGSKDRTLEFIKKQQLKKKKFFYISFSRNFGHQNALKAGLDFASGDCVISMDADLQHPPTLINDMLEKWKEGYEIVYTVRNDKKIGTFKKISSKLFYLILNSLSDYKVEYGAADFRLLDKKIINIIKQMEEPNLFLRGIVSWVGFKQFSISYVPAKRFSGSSKYSIKKMIGLAINGVTSFSVKPLRISVYFGYMVSCSSFLYGIYAITMAIFTTNTISGWTSLLVSTTFLGGIQMIMIGILGEYLGKLFIDVKKRPNYIIKEKSKELL